jgi:hypothetical protein
MDHRSRRQSGRVSRLAFDNLQAFRVCCRPCRSHTGIQFSNVGAAVAFLAASLCHRLFDEPNAFYKQAGRSGPVHRNPGLGGNRNQSEIVEVSSACVNVFNSRTRRAMIVAPVVLPKHDHPGAERSGKKRGRLCGGTE